MKSIGDFLGGNISVENSGENYGAEVASNSGIIVVKVVNEGLGYENTKALCADVVREELNKYKAEAREEALRRDGDLFERVVAELSERKMTDEEALSAFKEPSMQCDYFEAQKAYIKAGAPELASMLSSILAERIAEPSRSLLQIALGESIQVAPKLIETQMATLAMAFILKHTVRLAVVSHKTLAQYIHDTILPIYKKGVSQKESEFQHLNFTGCSQHSVVKQELSSIFLSAYPGLFMTGIGDEEMPRDPAGKSFLALYPSLFVRCLNNDGLLQINAVSEEVLSDSMEKLNVGQEHRKILEALFQKNRMSKEAVQKLLIGLVPEMQAVFDYWSNSGISNLILTSVGIIIGAQYAKIVTDENYKLSTWI